VIRALVASINAARSNENIGSLKTAVEKFYNAARADYRLAEFLNQKLP